MRCGEDQGFARVARGTMSPAATFARLYSCVLSLARAAPAAHMADLMEAQHLPRGPA
jgi:hypothetical protein